MEDKERDYKFFSDIKLSKLKWNKKTKILLISSALIIVVLIVIITIIIINSNSNEKSQDPDPNPDPDIQRSDKNLTYDVNGMIENSFKKGGDNYNEDIGNINNGLDYEKNDRNIYDLYIPKNAENRKNGINGIVLWIHGGSWISGDLKQVDLLCKFTSQLGYISATVGYTLLINNYKDFSIFKILDEITACIKAIKKELKDLGFDANKLKLAIGGYSAGSHIALLYSYLIKDINIIPIQFVIDFVGPIGLDPKYYYKFNSSLESLESIEDLAIIEQAIKDGKIVKNYPDLSFLTLMNAFSGNKYTAVELALMLNINGNINYESKIYLKMFNQIRYGYITEFEIANYLYLWRNR